MALVGPSGGGKSTVLSLLPRFYDVTGGAVTVNGRDVRQLKTADLRDRVALVACRGSGADLLLAPTRSLVRAKRALASLPGGGGTPEAQIGNALRDHAHPGRIGLPYHAPDHVPRAVAVAHGGGDAAVQLHAAERQVQQRFAGIVEAEVVQQHLVAGPA